MLEQIAFQNTDNIYFDSVLSPESVPASLKNVKGYYKLICRKQI